MPTHRVQIIHCNLQARNLLVSDNLVIKVANFGCPPHGRDAQEKSPKGRNQWLAPEAWFDQKFSEKVTLLSANFQSDIWAYAVTMMEVFSLGDDPFERHSFDWEEMRRGKFLRRPIRCDKEMCLIIV